MQLKAQENIAKDRYLLSQLETFAEIRPIVFQQQQLQKTLQQLAPQIHQKHNEFSTLTTQFEQQKTLYAQAETTLNQFQDFERKHQTELTQVRKFVQERDYIAEEYKKTKIRLTQLESQQQPLIEQQQQLEQSIRNLSAQHTACLEQLKHSAQYAPLDKGLNAHIQQLKQFIQQYQKVEHTLGSIQQAQTQLEQDQNTFNNLVTQFGVTQQIEQRIEQQSKLKETQQIRINQLDAIQQKLQHYFELKNEVLTQQNKFEALQKQVQQLEQCSKKTEQDYHAAKTEREKLQLVLQQQRLLHAENIEHLRAELKHGEACLVCGSTEHPYRDNESQISKTLYALQQQQEQQAIQQEQQLFQLWQKAQQQFTQSHTEHNQLQQQLQQLHDKLKTHDQLLQQQVSQTNIQLDFSLTEHDITTKMQSLVLETSQTQQQLEKELLQLNQANKDQHVLNQNIQNILHQLQTIEHLQQQIQHIVDCLNADDKMAWSKHDVSISQHILQALQQRSQQLEHAESLIKQKEQINQQLNVLKTNFTGLTTQQTECAQQLKDIEIKGKQNTDAANQLIITMTGSAEIKANEWLQQHDQQRQQLQNQYQQVKQSFEQARQHFEQQKNVLEQLKVQQQQNHDALELCKTEITNWLAQHQNFAEDQLSELHAFSSTQEQQIRNAIQQADRALSEANSALKTMQEQLNVHLQSEPNIQVEQLTELINANQEILQQTTDQRDQLKLQLEVHQQNLAKQKKFADQIQQIQQQEHRWNKISSLIGDSKGKEFRDLAQQYNLDILLEYANQQLAMLSQRYTLKRLDNSLSLAIIDHDMDGETRSVASLSGGESFLTALAISLAIANMASGSMKIESLFIDEGFGTLDASSLHMVMNALDQLQSQGRKVILISHIQEMHERIPVQIQVQPMGSGSSRIEVVG